MKFELHGLVVESEIEFPARSAPAKAATDVRVEAASTGFPEAIETVAALGPTYRVARDEAAYYLSFRDACDFRLSHDGSLVQVAPAEGVDPELVSLLLAGNALSLSLMLRDAAILHASAVEITTDRTVAFVGRSGMGKSTLAGLLCSAGGALVADDVLRVAPGTEGARCYAGSPELRLRGAVGALADLIPSSERRKTCDHRIAVRVEQLADGARALDAIIVPQLGGVTEGLALRRLDRAEATLALLQHPRLPGWRSSDWCAWHLRHAAAVARAVPVFEAALPRLDGVTRELGSTIGNALLGAIDHG